MNKPSTWPRLKIFRDVSDERESQLKKWGVQYLPDLEPVPSSWACRILYKSMADDWKQTNAYRVNDGTIAWDGILLEEVYEALAEGDTDRLREELIQAAAVIVAWVEDIDSRGSK